MRVTKNIRIVLSLIGALAIGWGFAFALPASAANSDVQQQADDSTATTSSTSTSTSTTLATTTTTSIPATTTTTVPATPGDPDNDGASNEPPLDLFDTGVTADRDPTVALLDTTADDGVAIILDIADDDPEQLRNVRWTNTASVGNIATPNGLVSFSVVNVTSPVDVITVWKDVPAARTLYKGSATALAPFATTDTDFSDGAAAFSYTLVDGGSGDQDRAANGVIVDPVAMGFVRPAPVSDTTTTTTTKKTKVLARTGNDVGIPTAAGAAAVVLGAAMLAVAWKPVGSHFNFDK
ncbi:MAG: hypothetical protein H0U92_06540 [Actinobacteria bacterium]|nr:hypothetical protein [Actinomycetota bacterium]